MRAAKYAPSPEMIARFNLTPLLDLSALGPAQADDEAWRPALRAYRVLLPGGEVLYVSNLSLAPP